MEGTSRLTISMVVKAIVEGRIVSADNFRE